ncbi:TKL protein kinase [Polytolypa hystricis UAMH7299]|uniref:TKL protein kinase n=1 Tax=Polytolypa hystricis (strain UAMH7299) TaxID=1447883 RepID=A0A2B7XTM4_POLH7|nr:TKL protein kinase [Polytolypa hystricis UAMH7299]
MAYENFSSSIIPSLATANAWTEEEEKSGGSTGELGLKVPEIVDIDERAHYSLVTVIRELDVPTFPLHVFDANLIGHPETYAGRGSSYIVTRSLMVARNDFENLPPTYGQGASVVLKRVLPRRSLHQQSPYRQDLAQFRAVISDLRVLQHPPIRKLQTIIDLIGISWSKEVDSTVMPILVMQCAKYGSLADFQAGSPVMDGPTKARLSLDVAQGLLALHSCRIIHGDVKSENILLDYAPNREQVQGLIAKVSDFGGALLDVSEDTEFSNGIGGTVPWMAPEASTKLRGFSAVQKTDVYSFGMLLWRIFVDDFRGMQSSRHILAQVSRQGGILLAALQSISALDIEYYRPVISQILTRCLQNDPMHRESSLQPVVKLLGGAEVFEFTAQPMQPIEFFTAPYASPFQVTNVIGCFNDRHANISDLEQEHGAQHLMRHADFGPHPSGPELDAAFQVFLCSTFGFGVARDEQQALEYLVKAARGGLVKAQAILYGWLQSTPREIVARASLPDENVVINWLRNAAYLGSHIASRDLREVTGKDSSDYLDTIEKRKREMSGVGQPFIVEQEEFATDKVDLDDIPRLRKYIQDLGVPVDELLINSAEETLLHYVSTVGATHAVALLLQEFGANPNVLDEDSTTPLLCACRAGHLEVAEQLVASGANPSTANLIGETPLHWLISFRDDEVEAAASLLLLDNPNASSFLTTCTTQQVDYTEHDLQWHPTGTPLHWAIEGDYGVVVRTLLKHGANALYQEPISVLTSLGLAARHGSPYLVEMLLTSVARDQAMNYGLESFCNIVLEAIRGENLYVRKVRHGKALFKSEIQTLSYLVQYMQKTYGCTTWPDSVPSPLLSAIKYVKRFGNTDLVHWLLENNIGSFEDREDDRSALHIALENDDHETFDLLLQLGADSQLRYTDPLGVNDLSLLHYLAISAPKGINGQRDNSFFVRRIVAAGVDLEHKDSNGLTALTLSLINFERTLVIRLLECGASIHAVDSMGYSVLGVLIKHRAILGVKFLLQECAMKLVDYYIINSELGQTTLQLAEECLSSGNEDEGNILDQLLLSVLKKPNN